MEKIWRLYENMDEIVYAADIHTYELCYMNRKAREAFGISEMKDVAGKKCYEILQGNCGRCDICTNYLLKENEYYEWKYYNPIVKKKFSLKDTLIKDGDRELRLEIAIDMSVQEEQKQTIEDFTNNEALVNEALRYALSAATPGDAMKALLEYLGKTLHCERVYIFEEQEKGYVRNKYEWCAKGVLPQKENLKRVPMETVKLWYEEFRNKRNIIIKDLEPIKEIDPLAYQILKPQDIRTLVVSPLIYMGKIIGFYGVDNPPCQYLNHISVMFDIMGHFIVSIMKKRELVEKLEVLSYHDQLTGAGNRHMMNQYFKSVDKEKSIGIVYGDVIGLKRVNDTKGHMEGDILLRHVYGYLKQSFPDAPVFRIGGDEFLVVSSGISEEEFRKRSKGLEKRFAEDTAKMALGILWQEKCGEEISNLLIEADNRMYQEKHRYYKGLSEASLLFGKEKADENYGKKDITAFKYFMQKYNFNTEVFFNSVSKPDFPFYLFFGDMQQNLYYLSDKLKDELGKKSNIIFDFLGQWKEYIYEKDWQVFEEEMEQMRFGKKEMQNFRVRMRFPEKGVCWVNFWSTVLWDEEKTEPLFISGSLTSLEEMEMIDSVTGLFGYSSAMKELERKLRAGERFEVIGFGIKGMSSINERAGRLEGDKVIYRITQTAAARWEEELGFYRLDGMRFAAVPKRENRRKDIAVEQFTEELCGIINREYWKYDIVMEQPCSVCALSVPRDGMIPIEIVDRLVKSINYAKKHQEKKWIHYSESLLKEQQLEMEMKRQICLDVYKDYKNFYLVVQPIIDAKTRTILGGEALLRWSFNKNPVSPEVFIPLLESAGLFDRVGNWVFEEALKILKRAEQIYPDFRISVNISYLQIQNPEFLDFIQRKMKEYKAKGESMMLELIETHFVDAPECLKRFIERIRKMGIRLGLDDFGKGYSSLQLLLQYPVNIIKLDRQLMKEITSSRESLDFIMSIVYACHRVGKTVCVEGVETAEELEIVSQTDCDCIQGYYFSKPLLPHDLEEYLKKKCRGGENRRPNKKGMP